MTGELSRHTATVTDFGVEDRWAATTCEPRTFGVPEIVVFSWWYWMARTWISPRAGPAAYVLTAALPLFWARAAEDLPRKVTSWLEAFAPAAFCAAFSRGAAGTLLGSRVTLMDGVRLAEGLAEGLAADALPEALESPPPMSRNPRKTTRAPTRTVTAAISACLRTPSVERTKTYPRRYKPGHKSVGGDVERRNDRQVVVSSDSNLGANGAAPWASPVRCDGLRGTQRGRIVHR